MYQRPPVPSIESLGLPRYDDWCRVADARSGLLVVGGPYNPGKATVAAATLSRMTSDGTPVLFAHDGRKPGGGREFVHTLVGTPSNGTMPSSLEEHLANGGAAIATVGGMPADIDAILQGLLGCGMAADTISDHLAGVVAMGFQDGSIPRKMDFVVETYDDVEGKTLLRDRLEKAASWTEATPSP